MRTTTIDDNGDTVQMQEVMVLAKVIDPAERQGGMRLNMGMKQEVMLKALSHGFDKRNAALIKEENAVAKVCWLKCFGKAALAHATALGLPWVTDASKEDRYGRVQKAGIAVNFSINGQYHTLRTLMPIPSGGFTHSDKSLRIKDAPEIAERVAALAADRKAFDEDYNKTKSTLEAMLQRISTFPSLEKNWPAGKQFYAHLPTKYPFRHQVPAVLIDELNAALGI